MIRIFNLFCKLKEIKISDQEWFGQAFRRLSLSEQSCPYCNSKGNLIPHDSYSRYMVSLKDNSPVTVILRVPRVKCTSCGHTHALLPEMLIPYPSLSIPSNELLPNNLTRIVYYKTGGYSIFYSKYIYPAVNTHRLRICGSSRS